MQDPSLSHKRPRFGCFWGTFKPSRRHRRSIRLWFTFQPSCCSRAATQQLASELERQAAREQSGLVDRFAVRRKRPLSEHLTDWRASLLAKGVTEKLAQLTVRRATHVFDECRFSYLPEISASEVQASVLALQRGGLSAQTCTFYLKAAKQFCRWCVRDGRATDNPLSHLPSINVRTDRRHDRRA